MTPDDKYNDELNNPELEHILSAMKGVKVPPSSRSKEEAWSLLMQSVVEQEHQAKVVKIVNTKVWLAVAASVVVFIAVGWSYAWFSTVEKYCPKGFISDVVLPDGSQITLNADTKIKYPKFYNLVGRKISLEGEAFFRVKPGSRFTVTDTKDRMVEVLGTEFDVNSRGEKFKVVCYEGSVSVQTLKDEAVKLTRGQKLEEQARQVNVFDFEADSISAPSWINGEFFFEGAKLSDVLREIENQFNIQIKVEGFNADNRTYSGYFRNDSLRNALDLVTIPMGLRYELSPDSNEVIIRN